MASLLLLLLLLPSPNSSLALAPTLHVYDHCPYCTRVRLVLGLTGADYRLSFLQNDDVATPVSLVGKKVAPIWVDEKGEAMGESMDQIDAILATSNKNKIVLHPLTGRKDLDEWVKGTKDVLQILGRPRYVATTLLPEFATLGARQYFVEGHQLPGECLVFSSFFGRCSSCGRQARTMR